MTEKKNFPIGQWIGVAALAYLSLVTYICIKFMDDMTYMWPYIILFIAFGIALSPPLNKINTGIKCAAIIVTSILIIAIISLISPVTLGTAIGHFISIFVMGYALLYFVGILFIGAIVGIVLLIGYLFGPCCCCWYWWD